MNPSDVKFGTTSKCSALAEVAGIKHFVDIAGYILEEILGVNFVA
jgi:hypothetical protein